MSLFQLDVGKACVSHACLNCLMNLSSDGYPLHHSIVIVLSPLKSLMIDQVAKLSGKGIRAAYVSCDAQVSKGIQDGDYQLIYLSPEALLNSLTWREMLAVDEAHLVEKWYGINSYLRGDHNYTFVMFMIGVMNSELILAELERFVH